MAQQVWTAGIDVGKQRLDIALWSKTPRTLQVDRGAEGRLAKNDRIDARTIAEYVVKMVDEDPARRDRSRDLLIEHLGFRRRIQDWIAGCENMLEHLRDPTPRLRRGMLAQGRPGPARGV
jgi:transposase